MALVRLCPWLYSSILVLSEPQPDVEPTTPVDKWYAKDCTGFLRLRGLPRPKLVADQRKAVKKEKRKPVGKRAPIKEVPVCSPLQVYQCII